MIATEKRPVTDYTRHQNTNQPWPLLLVAEQDARAMLGMSATPPTRGTAPRARTKSELHDDLKRAVVRLARTFGRRQRPDEGGVRCFVLAEQGTLAGVFWSSRRRLGFVLQPHPRLTQDVFNVPGNLAKYRSKLLELLTDVGSLDELELNEHLQNIRVLAAADIVGGEQGVSLHQLYEEVQKSNTEYFAPAEDPSKWISHTDSNAGSRNTQRSMVDQLMASYDADALSHISYVDEFPLPSRRQIVRILHELFKVLYPGFHGPRPNAEDFEAKLRCRLSKLRKALARQIRCALRFQHGADEVPVLWDDQQYVDWTQEKVKTFLAELPRIRWALGQDIEAALRGDPAVWDHHEIVMAYPGVYAVTVYRLAHALAKCGVPLIPRIMTEHAHSKTGIDIHPEASIQPGFFCDHGTGIVVGQTSRIGRNCTLYQGVTLGALNFPRDEDGNLIRGMAEQRHPTLEDNVVVYANATVLGGETVVGMNSAVGGNVWLSHSLPTETVAFQDGRPYRTKERPALVRAKLDASNGI